jgi:hypothetical protein
MTRFIASRLGSLLAAASLASACATLGGTTTPQPAEWPGQSIDVTLLEDPRSPGQCRTQARIDPLFARAGMTVRWMITNSCGRPATVTVRRVREKHTLFGGTYPFVERPLELFAPDGRQPYPLAATVLPWANMPSAARGFHVYTYTIAVQPGGAEDLEIIVQWP